MSPPGLRVQIDFENNRVLEHVGPGDHHEWRPGLMSAGEWCQACGRQSGTGFSVPDGIWKAAVEHTHYNILCVVCFAAFADARLIEWDRDIQFWPVSLVTSMRAQGLVVRSAEEPP